MERNLSLPFIASAGPVLIIFCCLLSLLETPLLAQTPSPSQELTHNLDLLKTIYPQARVTIDKNSGLPSSISNLSKRSDIGLLGQELGPKKSPEEVVIDFFKGWGPGLLDMREPAAEVRILGRKPDPRFANKVLVKVQQVSGNIDILGAEALAVVNVDSSSLDSINLDFVRPPSGPRIPKVDSENAVRTAMDAYKKELSKSDEKKKLEIAIVGTEPHPSAPKLVFAKVQTTSDNTMATQLSYLIKVGTYVFFVDATEGTLINNYREISQSQERHTFDTNFVPSLPGQLVLSQDMDVVAPAEIPPDARSVHAFASIIYEYYRTKFNREGYDGVSSGTHAFESCVRFPSLQNALWIKIIQKTIYGPGYATGLDIAAHEWTHAVIEHQSGLGFKDEPGALNESLADFFGVMVRAHKQKALYWSIGDTLPGHAPPALPLRDLCNPHGAGFDRNKPYGPSNSGGPEHYSEFVRDKDLICVLPDGNDNGCIHMNSGIFSKALQLAVDGGDHHGVHVSKLGSAKIEQIVYTAITRINSETSLLKGAQIAVEACQELQAVPSIAIGQTDCANLSDAFSAVGLK
jgi:Zn-dependent metalloprotease